MMKRFTGRFMDLACDYDTMGMIGSRLDPTRPTRGRYIPNAGSCRTARLRDRVATR